MKRSQLQALIREALDEVLNESTIAYGRSGQSKEDAIRGLKNSRLYQDLNAQDRASLENGIRKDLNGGVLNIGESEIDEGNQGVVFKLSPDADPDKYFGKKAKIISAMKDIDGPISKISLAAKMELFTRDKRTGKLVPYQNPINADFNDLVKAGVIIAAGSEEQNAPRLKNPPPPKPTSSQVGDEDDDDFSDIPPADNEDEDDGEDELPSGYEDPEGGVAGEMSDEEVEASFAKAKRAGEEEPEASDIETGRLSKVSLSPEESKMVVDYIELKNRLSTVTSDINREKRGKNKGNVAGDIRGNSRGVNITNLETLQAKLIQKMKDLVDSASPAAKAIMTKEKSSKVEPLDIEPTEPEELDEWTKNKLQYYAGIIK